MSIEFRMPALGADMEAGTLLELKVSPGDRVGRGDVVAVIDTDKGAIDVEIFSDGTVERLLVEPGTRVPVGAPLALLVGEPDAAVAEAVAQPPRTTTSASTAPSASMPLATMPGRAPGVRISPAARALAERLAIDAASLTGSGPHGAVSLVDVEAAARATPKAVSRRDTAPMRAVIAAAMARSKREIPHYYVTTTCDYTPVLDWVAIRNAGVPVEQRVLPVVPLLRAVVLAATQIPGFNGHCVDGRFDASQAVHLGVAVALRGGGLVTPAILDAGDKDVACLMRALSDLVGRARAGGLRASELASGTITVTSLGDEGVESVQPIIYPPQVAIVGAGAVVERPWLVAGEVRPRRLLTLTLAADHRVSDGRAGARFLARVADLLARPEAL